MKITKRQLKRIIKEERARLLAEQGSNIPSPIGQEILRVKDSVVDIASRLMSVDSELAKELKLEIDKLRELGYKA